MSWGPSSRTMQDTGAPPHTWEGQRCRGEPEEPKTRAGFLLHTRTHRNFPNTTELWALLKHPLNVTKYRIYLLLLLQHSCFCTKILKRPRNETFWYKAAKPKPCSVTSPQAATLRARMRLCHSSPCVKSKDTAKLQRSLRVAKDFSCSSITSSGALFAWAAWLSLTKQTWLLGPAPSHPQLSFPDFSVRIKPGY